MKNLTKRNQIVLGVVAVVLVLVVAVMVLPQTGGSDLSGGSVISISTPDFSVHVGTTWKLTVNSLFGCNWSSSNPAIAGFVGDTTKVKEVTVIGVAVGSAVIKANCAAANPTANVVVYPAYPTSTPTATRTPIPPPTSTRTLTPTPVRTPTPTGLWLSPANITVSKNAIVNYTVQNAGGVVCTNWSSSKGSLSAGLSNGASLYVDGYPGVEGTGYVKTVCGGQTVQTDITVQ